MNKVLLPISIGIFLISTVIVTAITNNTDQKTNVNINAQQAAPTMTVVAKNLSIPWSIAFLPDGNILFTERAGKLRVADKAGQVADIATIADVKHVSEGGLLGVAIHPQFATNNFVYLYYTYGGSGNSTLNKVVRGTLINNQLGGLTTLIDAIPGGTVHDGGRIKFGPDGFLYITTGDSGDTSLAQDTNSLAGKILRVKDDGTPAPGNPFNNRVYSYGHRNPQGITWNGTTMYATEHGNSSPSRSDEINFIEMGKNYGWPTIEGDAEQTGMVKPIKHSGNDSTTTWAPSGTAFYNGSVFFGGLKGQALYEAKVQGATVTELKEHFKGQIGRVRDVVVGPDNQLYITTSNHDGRGSPKTDDDKIIKVTFANQPTTGASIGPTLITPTIYCVGGSAQPPCATIAPSTATPTFGSGSITPATSPSGGVNPTSTVPSPTVDPCSQQQNSIFHDKGKKKKKFKKDRGGGGNDGGFIEMFLKFILWLIEYILKGGNVPPPDSGTPVPTPDPSNPCPEPTSSVAPTAVVAPTSATAPTGATAPTTGAGVSGIPGATLMPTLTLLPTRGAASPTVAPTPNSLPVTVGKTVLFTSNFNAGTIAPWTTLNHCPPLSEGAVVSDFVREGGFAYKVRVKGNCHRAALTTTNANVSVKEGDERWYQWSMRFADNFTTPQGTRNYFNVLQWGTANDSAPLAVFVTNDGFVQVGGQGSGATPQTIVEVAKGLWIDYTLHVKFSTNGSVGFVEAWQNGRQVIARTNRVTLSGASQSLQFGLNRDDANLDIEHEIWLDNLRITAP